MSSFHIYGHRGSSGTHPENTLLSFQAAHKAGAQGIELDVQLTKDLVPVVIHDERLERTTNGIGFVKDFLYEDLVRLDAGHSFSSRFQGNSIPSLKSVLEWITSNSLMLNIELKNGRFPYDHLETKVLELLTHYHLYDRTIISSFNHYSIQRLTQNGCKVETAILLMEKLVEPWDYLQQVGANSIHIECGAIDEYFITNTHKRGIPVRAFTVNDPYQIAALKKAGCSAIFTDFPLVAMQSI
ncbi:glycerophosphodiester phosphodiesterase [Bacillus hwajinpoensis]|uniref:Glycerophosphodiester phosphodiesterase n=1 Tax=Guptibacillus hwajinpoensis TaxID=208199 RepID=A0A845F4H7_9BACL|nr:glycerophosphodiester phosphodiesterase [Pseudalkalibacillus hwajinpoensis]MYL65638.1 glycerophosphodiester phosphodiesterase [Pseudalkalibacillus hwajinpoensis]